MAPPSDPATPTKAPTSNKTAAATGGAASGSAAGVALLAFLHWKYGFDPGPELAATIAGVAATMAGGIATFFMPLITAAQQAALRHLNDEGKPA